MDVLVTGKGSSGSWAIRGEQLGEAIGADVRPCATKFDGYDAVVVVKRATPTIERALQGYKGLIVWDIVDCWPQKSVKTIEAARQYVYSQATRLGAQVCVFATEAQRQDLPDLAGFTLCHHARPGIRANPIRETVTAVGYEGSPRYLEPWAQAEVESRGWRFVLNPEQLADVDIVIATRGSWDSDVVRRWKSNVKLANAQGSGTPCILPYECGYTERCMSGPMYYRTREEFSQCLDALSPRLMRKCRSMILRTGTPMLKDVARRYRDQLSKYWSPQ